MATLEKVMQMRRQGIPESQIVRELREGGINPREINEALSQSKIKSALAIESSSEPINQRAITKQVDQEPNLRIESEPTNQMRPSIMPSNEKNPQSIPEEQLSPQQNYEQEIPSSYRSSSMPYSEYPQENYPQEQYAPEQYPQQAQYQEYSPEYSQSANIETINEIAEQIVEEKIEKLKKQTTTFLRFKEEITLEIEKINQRLEKIENVFNALQVAILKKIGDYGEDIKNISKEMHQTQESFSKVINPLTDMSRQNSKQESSEKPKSKTLTKKKGSDTFENYLRA